MEIHLRTAGAFGRVAGSRFTRIVLVDATAPRSYALHEENPVADGDLMTNTANSMDQEQRL
jgi:hypothetical protein